jgi:hypothetical protein
MYKEQMEIITAWKKFLAEIETKMQSSIKKVLNEAIITKDIYAMFFEYEYDYMDIMFFAIDHKENVLLTKVDILNDEINCEHLFPDDLSEKQMETNDKYDGEDDNYDDFTEEYYQKKEKVFKEWFISCWDKIKGGYINIPKTFFSIHDTNYKINLDTKETVKYDEIIK